MLSFTFVSPRIAVEKGDFLFDAKVTDSKLDAIHGGTYVAFITLLFVRS
jgi:hypothetical protein